MMTSLHLRFALAACLAICVPAAAAAQSIPYGDPSGEEGSSAKARARGKNGARTYGVEVHPYIEAAQVVTAELSPGDEVLTYTRIAAGVDASAQGRNNGASVSLRYERYIGWGDAGDGDAISGIARGYGTVAPGVQIEAGGLAVRTRVEANGASVLGPIGGDDDAVSQVYSVYAGPTVATRTGDVQIEGAYRIGYTRVEAPDAIVTAPGQPPIDVFDESVVHMAEARAAVAPHDVLPVGLAVGGGYYREDISNLDQRIEDAHVRADVTVPVGHSVALVAGVGYEDVEISSRDALRDANGLPILGRDGRFVTDDSGPRRIAYEADGLILDAGVIWRPSRRTALEAHVGRRYGTTSYYGSFAYAPNARSSINVSVYDNVAGFGGQVNRALADLPVEFRANRNLLTGDLTGCVEAQEGSNCLAGVLGSVRSSTFRARGVMASYNVQLGRLNGGLGAGYDRRKFLAAPGTVLAAANGVVDENTWLAAYLNARLSQRGTLSSQAYANWFQTRGTLGDATALGASTAYGHLITNRISATAAVGIDGLLREDPVLEDIWTASALVGVRYTF